VSCSDSDSTDHGMNVGLELEIKLLRDGQS